VDCHHCGDPVQRRRRSASGLYFCSKTACQTARRRSWSASKLNHAEKTEQGRVEQAELNSAAFLQAVMHADRVQCPECGLVNALPGWRHPNAFRRPCDALGGGRINGLIKRHYEAVWPRDTNVYADA
jgi:endogenous inhibitor of DNA gyrase (YacG/DUF329 family)